jgi:hypothetical protein
MTRALWVVAVLAVVAGGCAVVGAVRQQTNDVSADASSAEAVAAPIPLAFVRSDQYLTTVDTEQAAMAVSAQGAIASPDGSRLFRTSADATGDGERLRVLDPRTGDEIWSDPIRGDVDVRVASYDGSVVALMEPPTSTSGYPEGRTTTKVVINALDGSPQTVHRLEGNFEPEAFSRDAQDLFMIEYVPAEAPTGYLVRQLDLATGDVSPVESPDIGPNDVMGGVARDQVMSPDGRRLYTLYSVLPGVPDGLHGTNHHGRAFVHVLDLDEKWAHCLQLPEPFGLEYAADGPLAISPDGDDLYVLDPERGPSAGGTNLVTVDTEVLAPGDVHTNVSDLWPTAAAIGEDGLLHVSGNDQIGRPHLATIDTADMSTVADRTVGGFIGGISVVDGGQLLLVQPERRRLLLTDSDGGNRRVIELPGQDPIAVGAGSVSLPGPRNVLECAC